MSKIDKEKASLKLVHNLFVLNKFSEALPILEFLSKNYPEFTLYQSKLQECRLYLDKSNCHNNKLILSQSKSLILQQNTTKEKVDHVITLVNSAKTAEKRKILSEIYSKNSNDISSLVELAKLDLIDRRFSDALHKAKVAISKDKEFRAAYQIAEQAAIELGKYEDANTYFLSQPPVVNPPKPRKRTPNPVIPKQFKVPPILGAGNDYRHILEQASLFKATSKLYTKTVSVIIPVYNRYKILANTLAALTHQTYPKELVEIIVVDDGSSDGVYDIINKYEHKLNLYYARQPDKGFRVAAVRNIGIRYSTGEVIILMDADILPCPTDIENYMQVAHISENVVLIGHRRYVDVSKINDDDILANIKIAINLPNINPNNDVADRKDNDGNSVDWRYSVYNKTNFLVTDLYPFTKAAAGNIAFHRTILDKVGYMDEEFQDWGCEDSELGYRLYNKGAYFIPMMNIVSLHQEPLNELGEAEVSLGGESFRARGHKITQQIFSRKCPAPTVRKYLLGLTFDIPKVSIYIPAYNAGKYIIDAIQSCLDQNFKDLEVCICDDGSTDNTLYLLKQEFSNDPRVRWVSQKNEGIGKATNAAINLCQGMYIAQLDADDRLKENAVKLCVAELDYKNIDAVYTDCDYIDSNGKYIRDSWCGGEFSRDWMATGMIATHFRMFRKRIWNRTIGCNEEIKNAVDLDLWLKIYEKGNIEHIHQILYSYRWHGENTSIVHRKHQEKNHLKVVADSLKRMSLDLFWTVKLTNNPLNPREFKITSVEEPAPVKPTDIVFLIPTCAKYTDKANAVRKTWAKQLIKLGFRYLFLMGNPNLEQPNVEGDILYVPCKDDYESLLLKLVLGYEFLHRNMDFMYVYKIDDDCYPNLNKLIATILPQLTGKQYIGGATHLKGTSMNNQWHFGKCSNPKFDKPYQFDVAPFEFAKGGYGYFLRKDILPMLFEIKKSLAKELRDFVYSYEDVRIAEIMNKYNISVFKLNNYDCIYSKDYTEHGEEWLLVYDIFDCFLMERICGYQKK